MKFIEFKPNEPQSFAFDDPRPYKLPQGSGSLYLTRQGEILHLTEAVADSLAVLKLQPGESICICMYVGLHGYC